MPEQMALEQNKKSFNLLRSAIFELYAKHASVSVRAGRHVICERQESKPSAQLRAHRDTEHAYRSHERRSTADYGLNSSSPAHFSA